LKQIISINTEDNAKPDKVLCEWGDQHCCIAGWSAVNNRLSFLNYYSYPLLSNSVVSEILSQIKQISASNIPVLISSAFPEAVMIPLKFYNKENSYIKSIYTTEVQKELADSIEQWQIVNVYSMPVRVLNEIQNHFTKTEYLHAFTVGLKVYDGFIAKNSLAVHFTPYNFRVSVKKEGQLLLAQMYPYQTPLDVVYYLLKITEEFSLPKDDLYVVVSGLIEESSSLYEELKNYFLNLQFAATPNIAPQTEYPAHYFSSMYNLSSCAS
jgi:hypothetical protein